MGRVRFEGFPAGLFRFLRGLADNNSDDWFSERRDEYKAEVLDPVKAFVADLGTTIARLNQGLDTVPRVGRTVSRVSNDLRFHKNRPPYRPFIYASFPRRGRKRASQPLLYAGIYNHGVSVGFHPGSHHKLRANPVQEAIKENMRLFQHYLDERRIADKYWEIAGGEEAAITKWPLPKRARRWVGLESFTVGEYFHSTDPILARRAFLDRAQEIMLDLYPLWLFAASVNLKDDLELYGEHADALARPLTSGAVNR